MPSREFFLEHGGKNAKLFSLPSSVEYFYDDRHTMRNLIEFIGANYYIDVTGLKIDEWEEDGSDLDISLNAKILEELVNDFVRKYNKDYPITLLIKAYDEAKIQKITAAEEAFKAAKLELEKARMPNISGGKRRTRRRR